MAHLILLLFSGAEPGVPTGPGAGAREPAPECALAWAWECVSLLTDETAAAVTRHADPAAGRAATAGDGAALEIRLLGELEVVHDGAPALLPPSKKTRALLAYLCATGRPHLRETLCQLLWDGPDDPRAALRWSLTKMRPLLDAPALPRLAADRERVAFHPHGAAVDATEVQALLALGVERAPLPALHAAAGRFRGPFLEGLELASCHRFAAWCVAQREEMRAAHVAILRALVARLRERPAAGDLPDPLVLALRAARTLVTLDPLAESSHLTVVQLLADLGRPHEALEQVERCRRLLETELHARPSAELEKLRRTLGAPSAAPVPVPVAPPTPLLPLVGRAGECAILDQALAAARAGQGREVVLVLGDLGAGKTRVLEELGLRARAGGGRVLHGRAFEAELVRPYGAWIEALRSVPITWSELPFREELAPLLPELGTPAAGGDRARLYEAVAGLLRALIPPAGVLVVALDDLQWFDEATAALLHFLARTLAGSPVLLAAAARPGEIEDNTAALRLLRGLEVDRRLRRLVLPPLGADEVAALLAAAAPGVDARAVHAESEGNPLFALEIARALAQGEPATGTVTELIGERLGRLDDRARRVLPWAAALGRSFDPDLLVRVTALPPAELLAALDDFERRGLVRVSGASPHLGATAGQAPLPGTSYDFVHDLVRQAAYRQISEPRRRLVHLQIARALAELPDADGALAGEIAHHAGLAGDHDQAAAACLRATAHCLRLFAHAEAAEVVARGLQHAAQLPRERRLTLQLALFGQQVLNPLIRSRRGREVASALSRVIVEARDAGLEADAALGLYARSVIEYNEGQLADAYATTVEAAGSRRNVDPVAAAEHLGNLAKCLLSVEKDAWRAEELVSEALALAGNAADDALQVTWARGMLQDFRGDADGAIAALERTVTLARRQGRRWEECDCLTRVALIELEAGRPGAALARAPALVELGARMGEQEGIDRRGVEVVMALARYALAEPGADAACATALAALRGVDAKGLLSITLNLAALIDLAAGRRDLARSRAQAALAAASAVDRPSQAGQARAVLARLAEDPATAAALLAPMAPALQRRLGLSERARRALTAAYHELGLPTPLEDPCPS
jgi:DNA-binding SARP family transcriptional activator